jgi:hypothetical protein
MATEFLTPVQIAAVETAIRRARAQRGIHHVPMPDGEAYAYQFNKDIHWIVNGGAQNLNIAKGTVLLKPPIASPDVSQLRLRTSAVA